MYTESLSDSKEIDFITTRLLFILEECVGLGEKQTKKPTQTKKPHRSYKQTPYVFHDCLKTLQKKINIFSHQPLEKAFSFLCSYHKRF